MASDGGSLPARMLTWIEGMSRTGAEKFRVARLPHGDEFVFSHALVNMNIAGSFLAHRGLPGELIAAGAL